MSDNSEMVDAKETPLAAVIDDLRTVQYIEITPLNLPSDDCYKSVSIDRVVEVKPEDLQDVKQEPADETDNESNIPEIASLDRPTDDSSLWLSAESVDETDNESNISEIASLDRPSDDCSLWLSAADDCYQLKGIEPVVEVKPEDLQDVNQEPADQNVNKTDMPKIDTVSHDRPSDSCSLWLFAADDCCNAQSIEPVVEVKPEDLQDVKQEPAVETDNEGAHYSVKVRFCLVGNCSD